MKIILKNHFLNFLFPPLMSFGSLFLILFFLKNNDFRAKMCGTLKINIFIRYNFCGKYFFPRSIFTDINGITCYKHFFLVLTLEIKFSGIFIIIFVISALKYVGIVSFILMRGQCFSEVHPFRELKINPISSFVSIKFA